MSNKKYLNQDPHIVLKEVWGYESFRENQLEAITDILEGNKDVLFLARTGLGKALHKETLIPVYPKGFKTMLEIKVGDTVFSKDGIPTKVTHKFQPKINKHYKITFLNGEVIKCCKDHLWTLSDESVVNTDKLFNIFNKTKVVELVKKDFVKYPSIDITSNIINKSSWYSKGSISSLPDSFIYNSKNYVLEALEGILLESGYREGDLYIVKHPNINVLGVLKQLLSILGITYKFVSLFDFEHIILFESKKILCTTFKKNLSSYLKYLKEEENISLEVGSLDTIVDMEIIKDNKDDYYCIAVEDESKTFLITKSYIPTHNSLVFQLPALIKPGMALVISPLLALMSDQVVAANKKGIRACTINSTLTKKQKTEVLEGIKQGDYDICYIAPESLISITMLEFLKEYGNISFISMDETHCFKGSSSIITNQGYLTFSKLYEIYCKGKELPLALTCDDDYSLNYRPILNIFKNQPTETIKLNFSDGTSLVSTKTHQIFYEGMSEKRAGSLSLDDRLITLKNFEPEYIQINSIEKHTHTEEYLYDIEVDEHHRYFVLAEDDNGNQTPILVHNCTSQYGHDFRPDYQKVGGVLRTEFPNVPIIALTATADKVTKEDIIKTLKFDKEHTGFEFKTYTQDLDRPNIHYHVYERIGNGYKQLLNILSDVPKTEKVIIYCPTKNGCDEVSRFLNTQGFKARPYYSTVKKKDKEKFTQEFSEGKVQIMCCTSSFGMGVDEEVRVVVAMALPTTLEDTVQYFGRAGRSGEKAHAYLLFDKKKDVNFQKWLISQSVVNPSRKKVVLGKIEQVGTFASSKDCYRTQILKYFDQEYPKDSCGTCSNCIKKITL